MEINQGKSMQKNIGAHALFFACSLITFAQGTNSASEQEAHDDNPYQLIKTFLPQERAAIYANIRRPYLHQKDSVLSENDYAWNELDLNKLIQKLDRTQTAAGSVEFRKLMHPTSNLKQLLKRRTFIQKLVEDEKLCNMLNTLIKQFAERYENSFINILSASNIDPTVAITESSLLPVNTGSVKYDLALQVGLLTSMFVHNTAYSLAYLQNDRHNMRAAGWLSYAWLGSQVILNGIGLIISSYFNYQHIKSLVKNIPAVDNLVVEIAQGVQSAETIVKILTDASSPIANSEPAMRLIAVLKKNTAAFTNVQEILEKRRATKEASHESTIASVSNYWSMPDSLDTYFHAIKQQQESFEQLLCAIATLDAYLSIACLHKEWQQSGMPVTFAEYDEQATLPAHCFKQLYNPLLDKSVANDFDLGGNNQPHHIMLTGPHACGKTVSMKTVAYGYILGQTITIIPAQEANFAPITTLKTYFNVGDNMLKNLSSFTAEHQRLKLLEEDAKKITPQDKCLMLVDEPLAKTIQKVGEQRATKFVRSIIPVAQIMLIMATHFEAPAHLETETNGVIKNFQPQLIELDNKTFKPTYKIIEGKSSWWFSDTSKRQTFIQWLRGEKS